MAASGDGTRKRRASDSGPLAVINGLRGYAIAAVIYHHVWQPVLTPSGFASRKLGGYLFAPQALASHGAFGVNLFFVLSGLVLALPYARGERTMASLGDARDYYVRRARRLLPLYYIVILVSLFVRPFDRFSSEKFIRDALELATFTFSFDERSFFTWYDPIVWSLAIEVWFSLLFPALVFAWGRFGIRRVLGLVLPICFAVRFYATMRHPDVTAVVDIVKDSLAGRLDDFVVGMALAAWFARRPAWKGGAAVAALAGTLCLLVLAANGWDNVLAHRVPYAAASAINNVEQMAFGLIVAALLASPPRLVALPFVLPPIQLLGMMSYSIYLWHILGGRVAETTTADTPAYLVVCFLLSAVTYSFVEFPGKSFRELFARYPRLRARTVEHTVAAGADASS